MIKTPTLNFSYHQDKVFSFPSIELKEGEDLLILGQSGVGKSTMMQLLSGLLIPHSGDVDINRTSLGTLSSSDMDQFRGRNIGMIFQRSHFVKSLNVLENLLLVLFLAGLEKDEVKTKDLLNQVGLGDKLDQSPFELSQGEQQRLSIASALIKDPCLILADEPTSSLDDVNCQIIIDLLRLQAERTKANLIIVTHDSRLKQEFKNVLEL